MSGVQQQPPPPPQRLAPQTPLFRAPPIPYPPTTTATATNRNRHHPSVHFPFPPPFSPGLAADGSLPGRSPIFGAVALEKGKAVAHPPAPPKPGAAAEVEKFYAEDSKLDSMIRDMQENLRILTNDVNSQKHLYLMKDDITRLPCFQGDMLIAIRAPHGTSVEVPHPDQGINFQQRQYQILLRSSIGPIDCYLMSNDEEGLQASSREQELAPTDLSMQSCSENATSLCSSDQDSCRIPEHGDQTPCNIPSSMISGSKDFTSGIVKIVPSDLDVDADYWLMSDLDVSITDAWRTEWNI